MINRRIFSPLLAILATFSAIEANAQFKSGGQCLGDIVAPFGVVDIQDTVFVLTNFNAAGKQLKRNAAADINGDGLVNGGDLTFTLNQGPCPKKCQYDFTGDGKVTAADLSVLLGTPDITGVELSGLLNQWGDCSKPFAAISKGTREKARPMLLQKKPKL